jgi:subtilase family serine protease
MRAARLALFAAFGAVALAGSTVLPATAPARQAQPMADLVHISPGVRYMGSAAAAPLTTAQCESQYKIACYGPDQLQRAYDLPPLFAGGTEGQGQTIAIVDSFGSPTIEQDLATFDSTYGLPTPKLDVIQPAGTVPPWDPKNSDMVGWAGETTLDVEWAHSMAPRANILLVETPVSETEGTTGFPEIVTAEKYVIDHDMAAVISQSFSGSEPSFPSEQALLGLRGAYLDAARHHVTVLTASGDSGAADVGSDGTDYALTPTTSWPDSDPLITGVGGTQLHLNPTGRHTAPDNVWNDTYDKNTQQYIFGADGPNPLAGGGGLSQVFSRPDYQDGVAAVVGDHRGVPDIAMSGACNGAVNVYQSFSGQPAGWYPTCGTSEATPLFSGIVALAAQAAGHPVGLINPALYAMSAAHSPGLVDVTTGDNTVSFTQGGAQHTVAGYSAGLGYDLASGVGTVDAVWFVPQLARLAGSGQ